MKKKLCYKSEDFMVIFKYYFCMMLILLATAAITGIINSNFNVSSFVVGIIGVFLFAPFFCSFAFLVFYVVNHKEIKEIKSIKSSGTKVEGNIIGWDKKIKAYTGRHLLASLVPSYNYYLYIEYHDLNKNLKRFMTSELNFNPSRLLGNTTCNVYLLDDKQPYATDFVRASALSECVLKNIPNGLE